MEKKKGFGIQINLKEGEKLGSVKLSKESHEELLKAIGITPDHKYPDDFFLEYIGKKKYNEFWEQFKDLMVKSLPEDLDCPYSDGRSENIEDCVCQKYFIQMEITQNLAVTEFVRIVENNRHIFKSDKYLPILSEQFISCLYFRKGKGVLWFDLSKMVRLTVALGFESLSEEFEKSGALSNLYAINNTLDDIQTKKVLADLRGEDDDNLLSFQETFFKGKKTYYETRLDLDEKVAKKQNTGRPNRTDIAYYAYYMSQTQQKFVDAPFPSVNAWEELGSRFGKSHKNIQLKYNEILKDAESRIKKSASGTIQYVINHMLTDNPKAIQLAEDELRLAKLK